MTAGSAAVSFGGHLPTEAMGPLVVILRTAGPPSGTSTALRLKRGDSWCRCGINEGITGSRDAAFSGSSCRIAHVMLPPFQIMSRVSITEGGGAGRWCLWGGGSGSSVDGRSFTAILALSGVHGGRYLFASGLSRSRPLGRGWCVWLATRGRPLNGEHRLSSLPTLSARRTYGAGCSCRAPSGLLVCITGQTGSRGSVTVCGGSGCQRETALVRP